MFPTTKHSVLEAMGAEAPEARAAAWGAFAEAYWRPVYRYLQVRWRRSAHEAEDVAQEFFAGLLGKEVVARYEAPKGSFHNYLRTCVDNHVKSRAEKDAALKRGGGLVLETLDAEMACAGTPEEIFLREWQRRVLELAVEDLRKACDAEGKRTQFAVFSDYDLCEDRRPDYAALAKKYSLPATQVTNYLAWARKELRRLALLRIAGFTVSESEYRSEARRLFAE